MNNIQRITRSNIMAARWTPRQPRELYGRQRHRAAACPLVQQPLTRTGNGDHARTVYR